MKIKVGSKVKIISGEDKGKISEVLTVKNSGHLIVKEVKMADKHLKPNPSLNISGGKYKKEQEIDISNVVLVEEAKPTTKTVVKKASKKVVKNSKSNDKLTK